MDGTTAAPSDKSGRPLAAAVAQGLAPGPRPERQILWSAPAGWTEKPGSGFRYASFEVPGPEGRTGDLSVTLLEGDAGGLLSNVNRWREQIGLDPLSAPELTSRAREMRSGGRDFILVTFVSRDLLIDGKFKKRLLAAVCSAGGKTWFFKLTGEDALVRAAGRDFRAFLESLRGL